MKIYDEIKTALEQLGYKDPQPTVTVLGMGHYQVRLNGESFGIWDDNKKTFVD